MTSPKTDLIGKWNYVERSIIGYKRKDQFVCFFVIIIIEKPIAKIARKPNKFFWKLKKKAIVRKFLRISILVK